MRGLHNLLFTWTTLLILFEPHHDITCQEPNPASDIPASTSIPFHPLREWKTGYESKESASARDFKPLRIHPHFVLSHNDLNESEKEALKTVLWNAISKLSNILSVISVDGPLILPREPCSVIMLYRRSGVLCKRIAKDYTGEKCLDHFKIPSQHLNELAIYNETHRIKLYKEAGPGLPRTDFVLYVSSLNTKLCNPFKSSALAYSVSCKKDYETGRPLAGQINFCPVNIKAQKFNAASTYMIALHEMFHVLGFSLKHFDSFPVDDKGERFVLPNAGVVRMITRAVLREMGNHFGCKNDTDFGGPISALQFDNSPSSHWDPILMHSSLMVPKEQKPYLTLIDPITLAVFEDSGWYKVNYSQADHFTWGKGQGCKFGFQSFCKNQTGFCTINETGCHYMRLTKARCTKKLSSYSDCGVFAADQIPCFMDSNTSSLMPDEIISTSSRCFISSLAMQENNQKSYTKTGRCYERKCSDGNIFVRVKNGDWILCPQNSFVQVEHFVGNIQCPTYEEVCTDFRPEKLENVAIQKIFTQSDAIEMTPQTVLNTTANMGNAVLSAEIHLISSTPLNSSLVAILRESLEKSTSEKIWKINDIGLWTQSVDRSQIRKFLSSNVLNAFKADIQHQMTINVNSDNLIACPSSSFDETKESSAISTFIVPLAVFICVISSVVDTVYQLR